jgi:tetratricopeptide (TPR) repeat protein
MTTEHGPRATLNGLVVFGVALVVAFASFGPAINAPFDFDDRGTILENPSIRRLWPLTAPLHTPGLGTAVSGRPVANYSFALNYALNRELGLADEHSMGGRSETTSYHVVSILLHAISTFLLFALIRDTLRFGRVPEDLRRRAEVIALIVSAVWLAHPIQTEAVNYVSQRTELLVSLFYLATTYAAQRAYREQRAARWIVAALMASLVGMGTKEVMLTAPLLVVLYDRTFLFPTWESMRRSRSRRWLYAGLAATAGLSVALILNGARGGTAGFNLGITWYQYFFAQATVIPRYVQLMLWPDRLTYDYGQATIGGSAGIFGLVSLICVGGACAVAWWHDRWRPLAFLGAWFFLILAPSSSFVPIRTEIAAERRVYLAFAAVVTLVVIGAIYGRPRPRSAMIGVVVAYFLASGWTAARLAPDYVPLQILLRFAFAVSAAGVIWCIVFARRRWVQFAGWSLIAAILIGRTAARSAMYRNPETLWLATTQTVPGNARAYDALANLRLRANPPRLREADSLFERAGSLDSTYATPWIGRAAIAVKEARLAEAETFLNRALVLSPGDSSATDQLGQVLVATGKSERALQYQRQLAERWPSGETLSRLGLAYLTLGRLDSASRVLADALDFDSANVNALRYLGATLVELGRGREAALYLTRALPIETDSAFTIGLLAIAYAESHQVDLAAKAAAVAVDRAPNDPIVRMLAGRAMAAAGRMREAEEYLRAAVRLDPNDPQALTRLADVLASLGRRVEAKTFLVRALAVAPGYPAALQSLEILGRR